MKVLFLDTRPVRRGAQVFIQDLKIHFDKSGIEVKRIFLYREYNFECLPLDENDLVLNYRDNNWMEKWLFFQFRLCKDLIVYINKYNPDIILCNGSRTLKYASIVKFISRNLKAKWVYRVIDSAKYWNRKPLIAFFYRKFIISAMDAAVGVSNRSLNEMISHYKFKKPSTSIFRAIDLNYFTSFIANSDLSIKYKIADNDLVLLFVGNLTTQKRPDKFIHIVKELVDRGINVKGLIVGDGDLRSKMESLIADYNLNNHILLAGYQKDVRPYFSIANILLLTSDTEGLPGVVLEAAALKRVSVCSDVGGIREFIENDNLGFVLEDNSVENFINAIEKLRMNPALLKEVSENAYMHVHKNFDISKVSMNYLNYFNSILTKSNPI